MSSTGKLLIILLFSLGTIVGAVAASQDCRDCARSNLDSGNSDHHDALIENKPPARLFQRNDNLVPPIPPRERMVRQVDSPTPESSWSSSASHSSTSTASMASSTAKSSSNTASVWIQDHVGAIVGISIGAAVLFSLMFLTVASYRRKARKGRKRPQGFTPSPAFYTATTTTTPNDKVEPSPRLVPPRLAAPSRAPSRYRSPSQTLMAVRPESAYFVPATMDPRHSAISLDMPPPPHPTSLLTGPARMSLIAGHSRSWSS